MQNDKRAKLGFIKEVKAQFEFLVSQFSYIIAHADDYYVKYESKITYIEIYHDRISYEMNIVFGTNKKGTMNFRVTIMDIIETKNVNIINKLFQASSESSVKVITENLAHLVKTYAKEFLLGDIAAFNNVQSYINNNLDKLNKQNKCIAIENMANSAWKNGEYEKLIDLYSGIFKDLNEIQKRRLSYAKSKMESKL